MRYWRCGRISSLTWLTMFGKLSKAETDRTRRCANHSPGTSAGLRTIDDETAIKDVRNCGGAAARF
jgi:hypothetical protein